MEVRSAAQNQQNVFFSISQKSSFFAGSNEYSNPNDFPPELLIDNFVSRNVVFVTIAYRLGVLGFWSTGTAEAPGNWAFRGN